MPSKSARGRIGGTELAEQLIALASSLEKKGDKLSLEAVMQRLGVDEDEARHLLELVLMAGDATGNSLALYSDDDESNFALLSDPGFRGHGIRLTRNESLAVADALKRAGVSPNNAARRAIEESLYSPHAQKDDLNRLLSLQASADESQALTLCAQALSERRCLAFLYRGLKDDVSKERLVEPHTLYQQDDSWYLDALDTSCLEKRRFKIERMENLSVLGPCEHEEPSSQHGSLERSVSLRFSDPHYIDLLYWNGLVIDNEHDDCIEAHIPYYGGDWLPRMIAASKGTVYVDDEDIRKAVSEYALSQLSSACERHARS